MFLREKVEKLAGQLAWTRNQLDITRRALVQEKLNYVALEERYRRIEAEYNQAAMAQFDVDFPGAAE